MNSPRCSTSGTWRTASWGAVLLTVIGCATAPMVSSAIREAATDEVTAVALREAVERSLREVRRGAELEVICVRVKTGDPSPVVMETLSAALLEQIPVELQPASSCRIERSDASTFDRAQVVESETGKRGIEIFTESLVFLSPTSFSVRVGFFQHPAVSAQWICAGKKQDAIWIVDRCDEN